MAIRKVHKRLAVHFTGLAVVMVFTGASVYSYDRAITHPATQSSAESGPLVESDSTNPTASPTVTPTPIGSPTIDTSGTGGVVTVGGAAPTNASSGSGATPKQSGFTGLTSNPVFLIICAIFGFGVVWVVAVSRDWLAELSAGHAKMRVMRMVAAITLLAFVSCLTWLFIQAYIFTS